MLFLHVFQTEPSKHPKYDTLHLSPRSAEVKNVCTCNYTLSYTLTLRTKCLLHFYLVSKVYNSQFTAKLFELHRFCNKYFTSHKKSLVNYIVCCYNVGDIGLQNLFTSCSNVVNIFGTLSSHIFIYTRWFKYDRDKLSLVYTQIVPIILEPPCTLVRKALEKLAGTIANKQGKVKCTLETTLTLCIS
jgi:hypothetical protein